MRRSSLCLSLAIAFNTGLATAALDVTGLDPAVSPCVDFYRYANHKWLEATPIPQERTTYGTFSIVDENNERILMAALDKALKDRPPQGSARRKAIDFYASGMDLAAIEKAGLKPLDPLMKEIDGVQSTRELARALGSLRARGINVGVSFGVRQDAKDSTRYIVEIGQAGLGLPDRDYYFETDERTRAQREAYVKHLARLFELSGVAAADAAAQAAMVVMVETKLAEASRKRADLRDPDKNYNKVTVQQLASDAPQFPWAEFFRSVGAPSFTELNSRQPEFAKRFAQLASEVSPSEWRAYLRAHVLRATASKLPAAFAKEAFEFDERLLLGRQAEQPRFRKVLEITAGRRGSEPMGQALGQLFVEQAFPPQAKARALELVGNVKAALADRLRTLDWMAEETRAKALTKLDAMQVKIGYPDRWRDYADADVGAHPFAQNWLNAQEFEFRRQLRRLGQPVDRTDWFMGPQAVNAYYNGGGNEIVFPAGILQPPFFDAKADDAVNYGGIGMVIGHEITHGFDDRGRKFDAVGNLRDWWTPADAKRYDEHAQRIVRQYSGFAGPDNLKVNGKLTLGENISDLGGVKIAYLALQRALKAHPMDKLDGLTPEQRFFLSFAQIWRRSDRPEQERLLILTDSHSPARYRVKGALAHLPEFAQAFSCDAGKALLTEGERASLW